MRPGEQPLKELSLAFAQLYCIAPSELEKEAKGWAREFADGSRLQDILRATRDELAEALDAEPPRRFVVYLDQARSFTRAPATTRLTGSQRSSPKRRSTKHFRCC